MSDESRLTLVVEHGGREVARSTEPYEIQKIAAGFVAARAAGFVAARQVAVISAPIVSGTGDIEGPALVITTERKPDENDNLWMAARHLDEEFSIGETYLTRQEAIDAYADDFGEPDGATFQSGQLHYIREVPSCPYDANDFFERAVEHANDEWWEGAVESLENDFKAKGLEEELDKKLEAMWVQFCEKHNLVLEGYNVSDVEHHTVGEDESDEELQRRKKEPNT